MRISDWSSDVCSSDLAGSYSSALGAKRALAKVGYATLSEALDAHLPRIAPASALLGDIIEIEGDGPLGSMGVYVGNGRIFRSEEHTSELQSLMRISYAVFCLKKKNIKTHRQSKDVSRNMY